MRALGCISDEWPIVRGTLEAAESRKWFKSVTDLLILVPQLSFAQALLGRFSKIERVVFDRAMCLRFLRCDRVPPFDFALNSRGELTIMFQESRGKLAPLEDVFGDFRPRKLEFVRDRVSRSAATRLEKAIRAVLS